MLNSVAKIPTMFAKYFEYYTKILRGPFFRGHAVTLSKLRSIRNDLCEIFSVTERRCNELFCALSCRMEHSKTSKVMLLSTANFEVLRVLGTATETEIGMTLKPNQNVACSG